MTTNRKHRLTIGVLTGGGDAPGLNAAIRGVVLGALARGYDVLGIRGGWAGLLGDGDVFPLDPAGVEGIEAQGGTMLGTSRTNPYKHPGGLDELRRNLKKHEIGCVVAIGGEDTLGVAAKLGADGVPCVGVPKTIDGDVNGTDQTIGFDTAVAIASEAIGNLHTTARSHGRAMVVEVMGRHAGWLTLYSGLAGGAHVILLPEQPYDIEAVCAVVKARKAGPSYTIIACSEGATPKGGDITLKSADVDEFNHVKLGGAADRLAHEIEARTGLDCKSVVPGYLQRSGPPSACDRVLGTRLGLAAVEAVSRGEYGAMVALRGGEITAVNMAEALKTLKTVPDHRIEEAGRVCLVA